MSDRMPPSPPRPPKFPGSGRPESPNWGVWVMVLLIVGVLAFGFFTPESFGLGPRKENLESFEAQYKAGRVVLNDPKAPVEVVLSENGYGKRTDLDEYRITNRGGKGVKTINVTEKTGKLISIQAVTDDNDLMIINRSGLTIRTAVSQIRLAGRATQGVRIINLRDGDAIASVMAVPAAGDEEEVQSAEATGAGDATPDAGQPAEE